MAGGTLFAKRSLALVRLDWDHEPVAVTNLHWKAADGGDLSSRERRFGTTSRGKRSASTESAALGEDQGYPPSTADGLLKLFMMRIEPSDIVERSHVQPLIEQASETRQPRSAPLLDGQIPA